MEFHTKIAGIPCKCRVLGYSPYRPMRVYGSGAGDASPPEHQEFSFQILDRKGYPASWLSNKLEPEDSERLLEEFKAERLGERYGYL